MEIFGNVEALKGVIERKYSSEINKITKEREKQLAGIDKELKEKIELLISHMKTATDAEVKKAYSMILSGERLKAKKEFEEKRESLISAVFKEAEKRAKKIVHTKDYVDFVKKNMPKEGEFLVVGDSDYYKQFFNGLKVDKNIVGLRFESEGVLYDFTPGNEISSKKDVLRQEISKELFS